MAIFKVSITFLMMFLSVVQASVLDTSSRECPPFWTRFGDNCYRFFGTQKTWQEAESHCQEFFTRYSQGHLASVRNLEENKFLQKLRSSSMVPNENPDHPNEMRVWIGLDDIEQEGRFVWTDGRDVGFTQWHGLGCGIDCDCVLFVKYGDVDGWIDQFCFDRLPHICKMSPV